MVAFLILANSYRQAVLPLDVMARANGLLEVMTGVLLPLGALIAGLLAKATSVTVAVWVGCVLGLFAVLPLLRPRIVSLAAPAVSAAHSGTSLLWRRAIRAVYLPASKHAMGISIARFEPAARRIP